MIINNKKQKRTPEPAHRLPGVRRLLWNERENNMTTKLQKMAVKLNEDFRDELTKIMKEKYSIDVQHEFNIISMRLHTNRIDGQDFTVEQIVFVEAFSEGFAKAMSIVEKSA